MPEDTLLDGGSAANNEDGDLEFPDSPGTGTWVDSMDPSQVDSSNANAFDAVGLEVRGDDFSNSLTGDSDNLIRGQLPSVYFGFNQSFVAEGERYKLKEVCLLAK